MPKERHSRFDVVLYRMDDSWRQKLVVEAAGPLRAAIEGFSRCVDDSIEVVDVHHLASVQDETSAITITIISLRGQRFRVRVTSAVGRGKTGAGGRSVRAR